MFISTAGFIFSYLMLRPTYGHRFLSPLIYSDKRFHSFFIFEPPFFIPSFSDHVLVPWCIHGDARCIFSSNSSQGLVASIRFSS